MSWQRQPENEQMLVFRLPFMLAWLIGQDGRAVSCAAFVLLKSGNRSISTMSSRIIQPIFPLHTRFQAALIIKGSLKTAFTVAAP